MLRPDLFFEFILVSFFFHELTRTQSWEITRAFLGEARVRVGVYVHYMMLEFWGGVHTRFFKVKICFLHARNENEIVNLKRKRMLNKQKG